MRKSPQMATPARKPEPAKSARAGRTDTVRCGDENSLGRLQRAIGNRGMQRLQEAGAKSHTVGSATETTSRGAEDTDLPRPSPGSRANTLPHIEQIQRLFGKHELGRVHVDIGGAAADAAKDMDALAFTSGERIGFRTLPDLGLAAHEAAHVIQQRSGAFPRGDMGRPGDPLERHADAVAESVVKNRSAESLLESVPRMGGRRPSVELPIQLTGSGADYPWEGEIQGDWSVALRRTPEKDPNDPHRNTAADLPRGTRVTVTGRRRGWLHVSVLINGAETTGYVSPEYVHRAGTAAAEPDASEEDVKIPSIAEAFVILKRAETARSEAGGDFKPGKDLEAGIGVAIPVLESTGKYVVDPVTFRVGFVETGAEPVEVSTIEDFILFVEQVERQYPTAGPAEVATEIRQLWFSDANWEILVSGEGIKQPQPVDIETKPNPIANRFDMPGLAPREGGKVLATQFGPVDIGHVMAGIDSALNPFPASYPQAHLASHGNDDGVSRLKYETLHAASGGDARDFTTWSGDLGQAYAEYLVKRHVENQPAKLAEVLAEKATTAELLGDIHGYIAVQAWTDSPEPERPAGGAFKISNVLRDLYLVGAKGEKTYRQSVEQVSTRTGDDLAPFIAERAKAFARPWFAKKAKDATSGFGRKSLFGSYSKASALEEWMREFDRLDAIHENGDDDAEKLQFIVDQFIEMLEAGPE